MADAIDRAVVRVGGKEIPASAIAAELQNHPAANAEEAWHEAAKALAIREMLLAEAHRQEIITEDCSDAEGRKLLDDDARIDALLAKNVIVPSATSEEAQRFYDNHTERFCSEVLVEAEHILFSASPDDSFNYSLAVGDARMAIREIEADPSCFARLAKTRSACPSKEQGGNLGQIGKGQTVAEFEDALFALAEGELCGEPVKSPFGVHVIRAGRRAEGKQLPFEMVEQSICNYLEEASYRRAMAQYLAILASETEIEGVDLAAAQGPLVQ
ncbi:peptidylprolyl isomerase [Aurantiacibacter sp. D1-12]|uniref:peptidylprolyl isomerase n=1 Tax=Aurantiacibacter sp. D1-12 TaxID=2993658 RepID=UPI00237D2E34|nr:peptidylprolyl isomerase [Aurantiacibacter sp. D1-12]MDE1467526.1 peptidylprolyl isomerase [Aurantiacibacter sp. D1-12]